MDGVLERPTEYGIYAQEDGEVDSDNDEREDLATVVDEVKTFKAAGFEDAGGEKHTGKKYGKSTCGNLYSLRGAHHQQMYQGNKRTRDNRHHEEDAAKHE